MAKRLARAGGAVLRPVAHWRTWDQPADHVVIVQWVERELCVVFPWAWARSHTERDLIERAKDRIREVEGQAKATLAAGSTLLAFSRHAPGPDTQQLAPETPKGLTLLAGG